MWWKKKKVRTETVLVIVFSIIFGFLSGILGNSFAGENNLPFFGEISVSDLDFDGQVIIDQPRSVVVEQDIQLKQIENDVIPTLASVYRFKRSTNPLNQIYLPGDVLGQAVVITADGWVMSTRDSIVNLSGNYEAIGYQSKKYKLIKFVEDKATGIVFGKMEAENLPVSKIGNSDSVRAGQTVAIISRTNGVLISNIKSIGYQFVVSGDTVSSSEELKREIILDVDLSNKYSGAVVVNFKGEMIGIVASGKVVPVNHFKNIINQVLEGNEISRPILGIRYIDLAQVDGLIDRGDKGALVYGNPDRLSPAFSKVLTGDVIKKVDDVEINVNRSLSDLISGYGVGDSVELLIQRGDEELKEDITLK
jgi:serine protease Do